MSEPMAADHGRFDELAAGYALHSLEPRDEQEFAGHLPGCPSCLDAVADYLEVTAAMAACWPEGDAGEPSRQLRERIMAAAAEPPSPATTQPARPACGRHRPAGVTDLAGHRRRRRLRPVIAGAAAAAVLAAGGVAWSQVSSSPGGAVRPAAGGCARASACREVVLSGARSPVPAARVIVSGGTAWLVPSGLAADDTTRQIYVLWQISRGQAPVAVGSFDVGRHRGRPIRIGPLRAPYRGTRAFAVSLEHGRAIPAAPSRPVAAGQVTS